MSECREIATLLAVVRFRPQQARTGLEASRLARSQSTKSCQPRSVYVRIRSVYGLHIILLIKGTQPCAKSPSRVTPLAFGVAFRAMARVISSMLSKGQPARNMVRLGGWRSHSAIARSKHHTLTDLDAPDSRIFHEKLVSPAYRARSKLQVTFSSLISD